MSDRLEAGAISNPPSPKRRASRTRLDDAIHLGLFVAGIGFVFVTFYGIIQAAWGSYLGADPAVGFGLSLLVLVVGLGIATALWIGREVVSLVKPAIDKRMSDLGE